MDALMKTMETSTYFFASTDKNKKLLEKYTKLWDSRSRYSFLIEISQKFFTCHAPKNVRSWNSFRIFNVSHSPPFCVFSKNFYTPLTLIEQKLLQFS